MTFRTHCLPVLMLFALAPVQGQFLKNLAKKAGQAAERTILNRADAEASKGVDKALDSVLGGDAKGTSGIATNDANDFNTAKFLNSEAKRAFYTRDVVIHTVNEKGETTDSYFDAEELAMRMEATTNENPMFTDSEGYHYAYNGHSERWEKTGLMRSDAMSFMMPATSISMLGLPAEPLLDTTAKFKESGLNLNTFLMVEWTFVYGPDDFRTGDYTESAVPCGDGAKCPAFSATDPQFKGTVVRFDAQGRLSGMVSRVQNEYASEGGTFDFSYDREVQVRIPKAVEVKMPFQDILSKGLDVDDN